MEPDAAEADETPYDAEAAFAQLALKLLPDRRAHAFYDELQAMRDGSLANRWNTGRTKGERLSCAPGSREADRNAIVEIAARGCGLVP